MTDWIADGESGLSVRDKLNALRNSVMIPIGSPVVISSPVGHVDFALPSGYNYPIQLTIDNVVLPSGSTDPMKFFFSSDGGATWNTGSVYDFVGNFSDPADGVVISAPGTGGIFGHFTSALVADVADNPLARFRAVAYIHSGSASIPPRVDISSRYRRHGSSDVLIMDDVTCELPTVLATQNAIRIQIGDDLSGDTMQSGTFSLRGRPT